MITNCSPSGVSNAACRWMALGGGAPEMTKRSAKSVLGGIDPKEQALLGNVQPDFFDGGIRLLSSTVDVIFVRLAQVIEPVLVGPNPVSQYAKAQKLVLESGGGRQGRRVCGEGFRKPLADQTADPLHAPARVQALKRLPGAGVFGEVLLPSLRGSRGETEQATNRPQTVRPSSLSHSKIPVSLSDNPRPKPRDGKNQSDVSRVAVLLQYSAPERCPSCGPHGPTRRHVQPPSSFQVLARPYPGLEAHVYLANVMERGQGAQAGDGEFVQVIAFPSSGQPGAGGWSVLLQQSLQSTLPTSARWCSSR